MKKYIWTHEFVAAFYVTMFSILSPLTHTSANGTSTVILYLALALCFAMTLLVKKRVNASYTPLIKILAVVGGFLLFDAIFRSNDDIFEYIYYFVIYGLFTIFFVNYLESFEIFLKCYIALTLISGVVMAMDPFQGYLWSNTYMEYGLNTMLPAFAATVLLVFHYKKKLAVIPMFAILILLAIFANKGAILTAILLIIVGVSYINNNNIVNKKTLIYLGVIVTAMYIGYLEIFKLLIAIADRLGIDSYALITISVILGDTSNNSVYNTRMDIWDEALLYFKDSPIWGNGIGFFSSHSEGYEHNLFLEILNAWGLIGITFFFAMLQKAFSKYKLTADQNKKALLCVLFIVSFVPLMSSLTFWACQSFWLFWGIVLKNDNNDKKMSFPKKSR